MSEPRPRGRKPVEDPDDRAITLGEWQQAVGYDPESRSYREEPPRAR